MSKSIIFIVISFILIRSLSAGNVDTISSAEGERRDDTMLFGQLKQVVKSDLNIRSKVSYARKGLTLAQKENNFKQQLYFTMALGEMYQDLAISDEAIGYYLQALSFARITKDTLQLVNAYNALSEIYLGNELVDKANNFNKKAQELSEADLGNKVAGNTFELKGRIKLKQDELFKARDYFTKAQGFFEKINNREGVVRQKIFIARVYEKNQLFNQSLSILKQVEKRLEPIDDLHMQSEVYHQIARIFKATGRNEEALQYVLKAEQLPDKERYFAFLVKTYELKSAILESMGRKDEALASYQKYMTMRDSLDKKNTKQEIMKFEVKHRARQQKRQNQLLQAEVKKQRELRNVFIMVAIGLVLTAAVFYAFLRYKQQQKHSRNLSSFNKQLEKRVKEKTRELEIEIEERIKKSNEAIRAKTKAEESDKLKTEFLNNISHEVRTPMNRIMGFSDLLLDEAPSLQVKDYAKVIYNDSQRLLKLITDLIELSRLKSENIYPDKEIFDLEELLEEVYYQYEKKFPAELSFRLHVPGKYSNYNIYTDKVRLKKILGHIIENSLKFTHTGWIEVGLKDEGKSSILIYVSDTGEGINKDKTQYIFDFFRQGDSSLTRDNAGVGAGLTIVKHLTEILGGQVNLHSKEGHGTTFMLEFPIENLKSNDKSVSNGEAFEDNGEYRWNGRRILILDDLKSNMRFLKAALERTGADVYWAHTEEETVNFLYSNNKIDLVILNEVFDNQHARKFVPKIKSIKYTLPVIVQRSDQMKEVPWEAGADGVITKPVSPKVLMEKIAALLKIR